MPNFKRNNVLRTFLPAALLLGNTLLFTPFWLYYGNSSEFYCNFLDILIQYSLIAIAILIPLLAFAGLVSRAANDVFSASLLIMGLLTWIQGQFLVWDFGPFNGQPIEWVSFNDKAILELIMWSAGFAAVIFFRRTISKVAPFAAGTLLFLQVGVLVVVAMISSDKLHSDNPKTSAYPTREIYEYSSGLNIIHIFMDAFRTDAFLAILEKDSFIKQNLEGFTVFRDNVSPHSYTFHTFPSVFAGKAFRGNSVADSEAFRRKNLGEQSFKTNLKEAGFDINLSFNRHSIFPNFTEYNAYYMPYDLNQFYLNKLARYQPAIRLLDVTLFRVSPILVKKEIFNDGAWMLQRLVYPLPENLYHLQYLDDYTKKIFVSDAKSRYHFIYILPPHPPFNIDEEGRWTGHNMPAGPENYLKQAIGVLKTVARFFEKLKKMGAYRNAAIILHSDHGISYGESFLPQMDFSDSRIERAIALLAIKPPSAKGTIRISDAQTSLTDIPATVLFFAGLNGNGIGIPVFQIDPSTTRVRTNVPWHFKYRDFTMEEYIIRGSVYDSASWVLHSKTKISQ